MSEPASRQYVSVLFEKEMLKRIDDFRFANRMPSRTEAIRALVQAALDKKAAPGTKK